MSDSDSLMQEISYLRSIVDPIEELRQDEGSSVIIFYDNPDFDSNSMIDVCSYWTSWYKNRFVGDNLAEAVKAKREFDA